MKPQYLERGKEASAIKTRYPRVRPPRIMIARVSNAAHTGRAHTCMEGQQSVFTGESRPIGGFISTETLVRVLVLAGTTGDNGTAGGTINQPVQAFLVG